MFENQKNKLVLKKTDPEIPDCLNFEKLRARGIDYLGRLSGHLWTDHNLHDPGITILETLVYGILDLAYRTNLPIEDILARNPESESIEDNFFTPAQILGCNPLTLRDYRKFIVDIEGVRNAWIEIYNEDTELEVRGLYTIYLDIEKPLHHKKASLDDYNQLIINKVKNRLHKHRNLCEDFHDIQVLEKIQLGINEEITT